MALLDLYTAFTSVALGIDLRISNNTLVRDRQWSYWVTVSH